MSCKRTKPSVLLGVAVLAMAASASDVSECTLVSLRPETTPFWRTAPSNTVSLDLDMPPLATSATLTVSGLGYSKVYEGIAASPFVLTLPEATSVATENVYDLVLTFDDGTVRAAKLGVVRGVCTNSGSVTARCFPSSVAAGWSQAEPRFVVQVPYGADPVTVDGAPVESGLDGACGWLALKPGRGMRTLALATGESATLDVMGPGFMLLLK